MRLRLISLVVIAFSSLAVSYGQDSFPVPGAEEEFVSLFPNIADYTSSRDHTNLELIKAFGPYGPLFLEVRDSATTDESEVLKNFYLGIVGYYFEIDPSVHANVFHCGPTCTRQRADTLKSALAAIVRFVDDFRSHPSLYILSHWGNSREFRINDAFVFRGSVRENIPTPTFGFVPSSNWKEWENLEAFAQTISIRLDVLDGLVMKLKDLPVLAIVRDPNGDIRVVGSGLSDNQSGLLFNFDDAGVPQVGATTSDGNTIKVVEQFDDGIYYYETS